MVQIRYHLQHCNYIERTRQEWNEKQEEHGALYVLQIVPAGGKIKLTSERRPNILRAFLLEFFSFFFPTFYFFISFFRFHAARKSRAL